MRALVTGDREAFYEAEIAMREDAGLPPFGRLAAIVVSAKTRPEAKPMLGLWRSPRRKRASSAC